METNSEISEHEDDMQQQHSSRSATAVSASAAASEPRPPQPPPATTLLDSFRGVIGESMEPTSLEDVDVNMDPSSPRVNRYSIFWCALADLKKSSLALKL